MTFTSRTVLALLLAVAACSQKNKTSYETIKEQLEQAGIPLEEQHNVPSPSEHVIVYLGDVHDLPKMRQNKKRLTQILSAFTPDQVGLEGIVGPVTNRESLLRESALFETSHDYTTYDQYKAAVKKLDLTSQQKNEILKLVWRADEFLHSFELGKKGIRYHDPGIIYVSTIPENIPVVGMEDSTDHEKASDVAHLHVTRTLQPYFSRVAKDYKELLEQGIEHPALTTLAQLSTRYSDRLKRMNEELHAKHGIDPKIHHDDFGALFMQTVLYNRTTSWMKAFTGKRILIVGGSDHLEGVREYCKEHNMGFLAVQPGYQK